MSKIAFNADLHSNLLMSGIFVPLSIVKVRLALSGRPCNLATTASDVASIDFLFSFVSMSNLLYVQPVSSRQPCFFWIQDYHPPNVQIDAVFPQMLVFLYRDPVRYLRLVSLSAFAFVSDEHDASDQSVLSDP